MRALTDIEKSELDSLEHDINVVTYAETLKKRALILHTLGLGRSCTVIEKFPPYLRVLFLGYVKGILVGGPRLLQEQLGREGILFNYEQTWNLFRFLKRLDRTYDG